MEELYKRWGDVDYEGKWYRLSTCLWIGGGVVAGAGLLIGILPAVVVGFALSLSGPFGFMACHRRQVRISAEMGRRRAAAPPVTAAVPPPAPAQKPAASDFNNEAAVTLEKDVSKMRIKLHPRQASLDF